MKFQEALQQLRTKKLKRFLLSGTEWYFRDKFISLCKSKYPEYHIVYPEQADDALNMLSAEGFFDEERLFIFYDFDKMKPERFVTPLKNSNDLIVLNLSERANQRSSALSKVTSIFDVVSCDSLRENGSEYMAWIKSYVEGAGFSIDEQSASLMYEKVGPNLFQLSSELEKLFIVNNSARDIKQQDVETYVSRTARATAYELWDSLLNRDVKKALQCIATYDDSADTLHDILKFLAFNTEKLIRICLLNEAGMNADEIADITGINGFYLKTKYKPKALQFGRFFLQNRYDDLCLIDVQLRMFKGSKKLLLERFLMLFDSK